MSRCQCGASPADECPGPWEPGCLLGTSAEHARISRQKVEIVPTPAPPASADLLRYAVERGRDLTASAEVQMPEPDVYWSSYRRGAEPARYVYVRLTRPEGYEDVDPQLIVEDAGIKVEFLPEVVEQPAQAQGWQPIETAPRDGTMFLCWVSAVRYGETDEGQPYEHDVSQADFCVWRTQKDIPGCEWFEPCSGDIGDRCCVTHWQPLPAPPSDQGKEGGK